MSTAADSMTGVLPDPAPVREIDLPHTDDLPEEVMVSPEPVILRGWVSDWPVVKAARTSDKALFDYLSQFDRGAVVPVSVGPPTLQGRVFYKDDFSGSNADRGNAPIGEVLRRIADTGGQDAPPLIYLASATIDDCLPGFRDENDVGFGEHDPLASIWIGTRTRIAAHNDLPRNLACVAAGRRRFTLFPPDQLANLYIGPIENTPAGRPISLVDFARPDLERFPRFAEAMQHAQVAEMEAGDALFIPSMWWHHVEALEAFNVLVNYWWRTVPDYLGTPQDVLNHAMLTIRDMPPEEKKIWKHFFDHYVFENDDETVAHIPDHARGILDPMTDQSARRLRALLLNRLNR
ncbi:cupin-like domain-containing protein [Parvularcula flava]|uniref:Cupin n=1 Tax=Aquisalinus luteolus TaxID=1566827 RepID=A0A8J3A9W4_9PROT|nr:cupin-like domain-containing protein [Aquisalinus luteolus]NHK28919.1 cupin-like domain-containing protein [Aquisalinus luteolus]GGI00857.1 cupin [Aquisalinus luteolus]